MTRRGQLMASPDRALDGRSSPTERRCGPCAAAVSAHGPHSPLLGASLPAIELPWTTALHNPAISWISTTLDLAAESRRSKPLILYLYPSQRGAAIHGALPAAFAAAEADGLLTAATLIGLSEEPSFQQRELAAAQHINHQLLSDPTRALLKALPALPTIASCGADRYAPFTLVALAGRVRASFRPPPDVSLRSHTALVADFLARLRVASKRAITPAAR